MSKNKKKKRYLHRMMVALKRMPKSVNRVLEKQEKCIRKMGADKNLFS